MIYLIFQNVLLALLKQRCLYVMVVLEVYSNLTMR